MIGNLWFPNVRLLEQYVLITVLQRTEQQIVSGVCFQSWSGHPNIGDLARVLYCWMLRVKRTRKFRSRAQTQGRKMCEQECFIREQISLLDKLQPINPEYLYCRSRKHIQFYKHVRRCWVAEVRCEEQQIQLSTFVATNKPTSSRRLPGNATRLCTKLF